MSEYKGKYSKCRTCQHVEEVMMIIVRVIESCPKKKKFSSCYAVDKPTCEECEHWQPKDKE